MRDDINSSLKTAMKARDDKARVSTLRLINAAIKNRDIAARTEDRTDGVTDDEVIEILTKMLKQREDSAAAYDKGCRPDLAEQERNEIAVIREFLPKQLSDDELGAVVSKIIEEQGAAGLKDMGRCMGVLKENYMGSVDFGKAGAMMKDLLK
ncbi:MAG: GatB/YqeY domain-containing protein [Pseudomonadota bacterium]